MREKNFTNVYCAMQWSLHRYSRVSKRGCGSYEKDLRLQRCSLCGHWFEANARKFDIPASFSGHCWITVAHTYVKAVPKEWDYPSVMVLRRKEERVGRVLEYVSEALRRSCSEFLDPVEFVYEILFLSFYLLLCFYPGKMIFKIAMCPLRITCSCFKEKYFSQGTS